MKIKCIAIGKTKSQDFSSLIKSYLNKINHYINFEFIILNEIKSIKNKSIQKNKEAEAILKNIKADSHIILLDENGKELSSVFFSKFIQHHLNSSKKEIIFIIGGAYGFSDKLLKRANEKISLSKMQVKEEFPSSQEKS